MIITLYASRVLLLVVGLGMPVLAACGATGATGRFDGFWQGGTLTLAKSGEAPAWTIQPGSDGVVLVMYRSEGASHSTADNEELVVQLTAAELAAGEPVVLESSGRVVRYQRGGQKLAYASTTVKGSIAAQRDRDRVRGHVSLTASAPSVNVSGGNGEVTRQFSFEIDRKQRAASCYGPERAGKRARRCQIAQTGNRRIFIPDFCGPLCAGEAGGPDRADAAAGEIAVALVEGGGGVLP